MTESFAESERHIAAGGYSVMGGRICMITGASSGIGRAAATKLAQMGATVILVCRDRNKGEAVVDEITQHCGQRSADLFIADLSSLESIRTLARQYVNKYERLHILINNAGSYFTRRHLTVDGLEAMFAVNYLACFLLTNLLLDVLKKSMPSRVINVTGSHYSKATMDFDDLQGERDFNGARAIAQSKLAETIFTYELARRLQGTGVTVNCLHPGIVATGLLDKDKDFPRFFKYAFKFMRPFLKSPEKGAETTVYLASSPEVEGVTGEYFVDKKIHRSSLESRDPASAKRLWDMSVSLAGIESP